MLFTSRAGRKFSFCLSNQQISGVSFRKTDLEPFYSEVTPQVGPRLWRHTNLLFNRCETVARLLLDWKISKILIKLDKRDTLWFLCGVFTFCNYRLPTKLREGNVFTGVCRSVRRRDGYPRSTCLGKGVAGYSRSHVWGRAMGIPGSMSRGAPTPTTNIWWSSEVPGPARGPHLPCYWHLVVITGDLFKLVHLRTYPLHGTDT